MPTGLSGEARVQLKTIHTVKTFLSRYKISCITAGLAAADIVNALKVRPADVC